MTAAGPTGPCIRFGWVSEYCKRAQILGVSAVGDAGYGVVLPVHEASLDGRLEAGKDLDVAQFARLVRTLVGGAGVSLVRFHLQIIANESSLVFISIRIFFNNLKDIQYKLPTYTSMSEKKIYS